MPSACIDRFIHPSAWNKNSANFAFWGFSEVRFKGILRTSPFGDSQKSAYHPRPIPIAGLDSDRHPSGINLVPAQ